MLPNLAPDILALVNIPFAQACVWAVGSVHLEDTLVYLDRNGDRELERVSTFVLQGPASSHMLNALLHLHGRAIITIGTVGAAVAADLAAQKIGNCAGTPAWQRSKRGCSSEMLLSIDRRI